MFNQPFKFMTNGKNQIQKFGDLKFFFSILTIETLQNH